MFHLIPIMKNKNKFLAVLFVATLILWGRNLSAAETNDTTIADLTNLVATINVKLEAGKNQEADFTDNLKEVDVLLAKHKGARPDALVEILLVKVQLYSDVLGEPEKAVEVFKQIKRDFPTVQLNVDIDDAISDLQARAKQLAIGKALAVGTKFPEFTTTNVTGGPFSLADEKGKVVLIDFWATWCLPCQAELPNVLKVYQKYHSQGFEIIGISLDSDQPKLESFLKENGMTWPQSCDGAGMGGKLAVEFGVYQIPTTFLMDGQGTIIAKDLRGDSLEQAVAKALTKK